jgi:peptidoglycan/LPS O-acetylase OafA/YrhL
MTQGSSIRSAGRVPSLDGIRAISIAMVVLGHAKYTFPGWMNPESKWWDVVATGSRGVSIFFVVSGFIITTLLLREREARGAISLRGFYLRRCFRIIPPFYIFLACLAVAWKLGWIDLSWKSLVTSATFVRDYINPSDWWTGHSWSLSVEEQFYLLWPVALVWLGPSRLKKLAMQLIVIAPALRILTLTLLPHSGEPIGLMFHMRVDGLMCGCALALMRAEPGFAQRCRRLLRWEYAALAATVLFFVSTALFWQFQESYWLAVGSSLENVCISYLLLYAVEIPSSLFGRFLNLSVVAHIGLVSYSLYLWQQVFLTVLNTSLLGHFPLNLIAALATAELSWWLIEKPSLALRKRVEALQRKPRVLPASAE